MELNIHLRDAIRDAQYSAPSHQAFAEMEAAAVESSRAFFLGVTLVDFRSLLARIPTAGQLDLPNIDDFINVLKSFNLFPEQTEQLIDHELAHLNTAISAGLEAVLGVQFVQPGRFRNAYTRLAFPEGLDDATAREVFRKVLIAPGADMSPSDRACLQMD